MTNISKMTNTELRLVIAEKLDMQVHIAPSGIWLNISKGKQGAPRIRNWPSDIVAAIDIVPKDMDFRLVWDRHIKKWGAVIAHISSGDCDHPARAICEAWLMAKRGNDGCN